MVKQNHFLEEKANDIILRVQKVQDLFYQSATPLSCKRLLHPDIEEFLIDEAEKWKSRSGLQITILTEEESTLHENEIWSIIQDHFGSKREKEIHQIKAIVRRGLRSLAIGFAFLIVMFLLTKMLKSLLPENALMLTLRELFIILAWVALWRPADLLLYEWQPHKRNRTLFDKLSKCKVQLIKLNNSP
ncbi:hypothetical protein [Flavisolibacter tropicus]|uniref:Uncharacterized protein n=1 Tax=Flavisolibacter tropicus TaxID=1492898 RepID=A0A172U1R3_9BACT|nr:hypothetical protein [Flavisolibacter tropicus]ANE53064.1 hypothetical protein SY85_23895 [Flavisolibacter tropicus]